METEITEHFLRHNYCVLLFEADVDLPTVQRLMGHDNLQTTLSVYTHYSDMMKASGENKAKKIGL
jgi:site-specific recombinase XerD